MQNMTKMRLLVLVALLLLMSSCTAEGRRMTVDERHVPEQRNLVEDNGDDIVDNGLDGENHHAYSIPDFNRQGGSGPGRD